MSQPPNFAAGFLCEAEELLGEVEEIVLEIESHPEPEALHRLFRAFHTIKGSGAMFGFDAVAAFTHHVETVLDKVREGELPVTRHLVDLILAARDHLRALLSDHGAGACAQAGARIIAQLNALLEGVGNAAAPTTPAASASAPAVAPAPSASLEKTASSTWQILFRPPAGVMATGLDPVGLLNELRALGDCRVKTLLDKVPPLADLQPDQCYLGWEITLKTDRGLNSIKDVFIFVEDESDLSIRPRGEEDQRESVRPEAAAAAASSPELPAAKPPGPALSSASEESHPAAARAKTSSASTVRVPSDRLDRLVSLVGELVINQSRLSQVAGRCGFADLAAPVEQIERLVSDLRDSVLGIRMMPIGSTFSRFRRLVRDLSGELGKEIHLHTEGEETEIDKNVIDQLADPLMHLLRNCIDHGIEDPDTRAQKGKPRAGSIRLAAAHEGAHVLITISDDGRGLDFEAIRAKAIEKKLIAPEAVLSEKELGDLIFLPGFSTAKQVTSVSGRGVGMDVVRRQIEALRGKVELSSRPGQGTTATLTLPLTLAIIEGLLVEMAGDRFILPMSLVSENVELHAFERTRNNGRNVLAVRGDLVPYVRLRELFHIPGESPAIEKVVIAQHAGSRVGLVVDRVLGSHQTVIQSLGRFYRNIEVVSGATIMGDGRVALILNLSGVVRLGGREQACAQAA